MIDWELYKTTSLGGRYLSADISPRAMKLRPVSRYRRT